MDIFGGLMDIGGKLLSGNIGNIFNTWQQERAYRDQQEYNKMMMQREDTAYQRKAKDLEAAGFSKNMAVSGPGSSTGTYRVGNAPQLDIDPAMAYLAYNKQQNEVAISDAQKQINTNQAIQSKFGNDVAREASKQASLKTLMDEQATTQATINTDMLNKMNNKASYDLTVARNAALKSDKDTQSYLKSNVLPTDNWLFRSVGGIMSSSKILQQIMDSWSRANRNFRWQNFRNLQTGQ